MATKPAKTTILDPNSNPPSSSELERVRSPSINAFIISIISIIILWPSLDDRIIGSSTSGFKPSELQGCATRFHAATSVPASLLPIALVRGHLVPLLSNYLFLLLYFGIILVGIAVPRGFTLLLNTRLLLFFVLSFLLLLLLVFLHNSILLLFLLI